MGKLFVAENGLTEFSVLMAVVDYRRPALARPPSLEYLAFLSGFPIKSLACVLRRICIFPSMQGSWPRIRLVTTNARAGSLYQNGIYKPL